MAIELHGYAPGHWSAKTDTGNTLYDENRKTRCVDVDDTGKMVPVGQCESWKDHCHREVASLRSLADADRVWSTPIVDGAAYYYIYSEQPLQLIFINCLDAYRAMAATIRGLWLEDIEADR